MPKGGLGNLIALPLQMVARKNCNSVFIDETFDPYADQWKFSGRINRLSEDDLGVLITRLYMGNELGVLKKDDEVQKPWATSNVRLIKDDLPKKIRIVKAGMVYLPKGSAKNNLVFSLSSSDRLCPIFNRRILNAARAAHPVRLNQIEQIQPKSKSEKYQVIFGRALRMDFRKGF